MNKEEAEAKIARALRLVNDFGTKDDYELALKLLEAYCAEHPNSLIQVSHLATIYSGLGLRQKAYDAYKRLLNPPPNHSISIRSDSIRMADFGEIAYQLGYLEEAAEAFQMAVANGKFQPGDHLPIAAPPDHSPESTRAAAHVASGMRLNSIGFNTYLTRAVEEFKLALRIIPSYEGAHFYLGKTLATRQLERYAEAFMVFSELQSSDDPVIRDYSKKEVARISHWLRQLREQNQAEA